jgi:hypothetical protein
MGLNTEDQDFASAFDEGSALDAGTVTEDMASPGLDLQEAVEEQGEASGAVVDPVESTEGEGDQPQGVFAEDAAGAPAVDPVEDPAGGPASDEPVQEDAPAGDDIEKERQRLRSWEGRLRAREAELNAKASSGADDGAADATQAVQEVAEAVESNQPVDAVLARLSEDFGQDFVDALRTVIDARASDIADKVAGQKVGEVAGTVDKIISGLTDERARAHFEAIADAHPDFMEVNDSKEFQGWIESLGDGAEEARAIVEGGSARQINKLLSDFKAASKQGDESVDEDAAMAAAQSVTGRAGIRLPSKPSASDDYEAAWNEAS